MNADRQAILEEYKSVLELKGIPKEGEKVPVRIVPLVTGSGDRESGRAGYFRLTNTSASPATDRYFAT